MMNEQDERFSELMKYRNDIEDLFSRIPIMTHKQYTDSLEEITGVKDKARIKEFAAHLLNRGVVLGSYDYIVARGAFDIVTDDKVDEAANYGTYRLNNFTPKVHYQHCMEAYNVVLNMFPNAKEFFCSNGLFQITFADILSHTELYEVIYVPSGEETILAELLIRDTRNYPVKYRKELKATTRRIALLEDADAESLIPYCGFAAILAVDKEKERGFRVLRYRKKNIWKDSWFDEPDSDDEE